MTAGNITRHFVRVGDREVHYRRVGSGPPFVLFHVSPQNSSFVLPQMMPLAADYTLIALDTPGYGESDGLGLPAPAMADYADAVAATFDALGIESAPVYGSHTGANVAVELARRSPGHVAGLILDGLSLSTPEVAQDRISRYAPPFTPTTDGAHLAWAWQHTRDQVLFWPWYEPHRANRLTGDVSSAEFIHDVVHAKMSAADYWLGYRAAFGHDSRDALRELGVDTYFVTAESDEHTEIERSIEGLPDSVHFVDTSREAQLDAIRRVLAAIDGQSSIDTATEPPHRTETYRSYVRIGEGQRLVRRAGDGKGRPVLMLHGGMRSSALLTDLANSLSPTRTIISVDVAGNGDSDPLPERDSDLAAYAADVLATMDACGIDEFDMYGESAGAVLALAIAQRCGKRAGKLILDRPEIGSAEELEGLLSDIAPPIEARWDGTHFLTAWHMLRDAALFWPWYRRTAGAVRDIEPEIEPVALQARLLAWLKGRLDYGDFVRAALGTDIKALTDCIENPCIVYGQAGDVLEAHAREVTTRIQSATLHLADQPRIPASVIRQFLDG